MARRKLDKELKKLINNMRKMIEDSVKADCNEAETRRRVERIFETLMGYDTFKHLTRELAVRGSWRDRTC